MKDILFHGYELRREIIYMVNDEDRDGPRIPVLMTVPHVVYRWDVPDTPVRPSSRKGRPLEDRNARLQDLLKARNQVKARGNEVTQNLVLIAMGYRGDTRKIRHWLHDLGLTWEAFKIL